MSRVGKVPISLTENVKVKIEENEIIVIGPMGELRQELKSGIDVDLSENEIIVKRKSDSKYHKSLHGLYRTLIANMVKGVAEGYTKTLEIIGVGYKAAKKGKTLELSLGFSHQIKMEDPLGIETVVPNPTTIIVKGIDKQLVGEIAARIRSKRPPEPYKGKGIRYRGEKVRKKVGKAGVSAAF
ncbi:MAG: 50S ribosomal protein L6 [Actinomycetota bacterium]